MGVNNFSVGDRIRAGRKAKGWSQSYFAELLGCTHTYVSYIETGAKGMSLDTFVKIANLLETSADELLIDNLVTIHAANSELQMATADCNDFENHVLLDIIVAAKES